MKSTRLAACSVLTLAVLMTGSSYARGPWRGGDCMVLDATIDGRITGIFVHNRWNHMAAFSHILNISPTATRQRSSWNVQSDVHRF